MKEAKVLTAIDESLRYALFGLQCVLDISLSGSEIKRIFIESEENQVSEKKYTLFKSSHISVTGKVDEYEPETIFICVSLRAISQDRLDKIFQDSRVATSLRK